MKMFIKLNIFLLLCIATTCLSCRNVVDIYCDSSSANCPQTGNVLNLHGVEQSLSEFNAICFEDLVINRGDIEGRAAVARDFIARSEGVSIGDKINVSSGDAQLTFSLVVGGNIVWREGELFPNGLGGTPIENIFIGGQFSGDENLEARITDRCEVPGCIDSFFNAGQDYYTAVSNDIATNQGNVDFSILYGVITLTCSSSQIWYYVDIDGIDFSTVTSYVKSGCSPTGIFVFNIRGTSSVNFDGLPFENAAGTIYNVVGSGRGVISQTFVFGAVINAQGTLNQTGGTIWGPVIIGNCQAVIQVNKPICPNITLTSGSTGIVSSSSTGPIASSSTGSVGTSTGTPCVCPSTSTSGSTTGPNEPEEPVIPNCPISTFESTCSGLSFQLGGIGFNLKDYDVITFGSLSANTGDIEGRAAAHGNVNFGTGFSIGDKLTSNQVLYSLIGGNITWNSGSIHPSESGIFTSGSFSGSVDLQNRILGSCNNSCLDAVFDAAKGCYSNFQSGLAAIESNTNANVKFSGLEITCDSPASYYFLTLDSETLKSVTYFKLYNCSDNASWNININGTGDVHFEGASFPASPENVIYNIVGEGRTIYVNTLVNGGIISPFNSLTQTGGVILGKVIVKDAFILQVNQINCPQNSTQIPSAAVAPNTISASNINYPSYFMIIAVITVILSPF